MERVSVILAVVALAAVATLFYRGVNHGLSKSSKHQQLTRLSVASLIAMLPTLIFGNWVITPALALAAFTSIAWGVTYPLLYHLSNRRQSSDYDNQIDIAFGLYLYGVLSALCYLSMAVPLLSIIVAVIEFVALLLCLSQWVYWLLYRTAIDITGMTLVQQTDVNEAIEFCSTIKAPRVIAISLGLIALVALCVLCNLSPRIAPEMPWWLLTLEAVAVAGVTFMMINGRRAPIRRVGVVELFLMVRDYKRSNANYVADAQRRIEQLKVVRKGAAIEKPHTIMLIIGESANRDCMSAFTTLDKDTTPWLSSQKDNAEFTLFPHAYSCAMVTVQALEMALTERNQYNGKPFSESVSIIDIAHKLGYKVHWYSNQGHLGTFDTQVTLVADTADVAKWTLQQVNKMRYDELLTEFLSEVDPTANNLIVLHLMGSHFNFLNRYPSESTVWGEPDVENNVLNYYNSIRYTDEVLRRFYEYGREHLNMQTMVYFSDHATYPDRTRNPGFMGYGMTRIPLFVWLSKEYAAAHAEMSMALRQNRDKYFTNDLIYELMCGIFDIESENYDSTASLASPSYRFTVDDLLTYEGTVKVADDPDL